MAGIDKQQCCKRVWSGRGVTGYACANPAKVLINGNWYCHVHDPRAVAIRREKQNTKWAAESALLNKKYALEGCARSLLEALEAVISVYDAGGQAPAPVTIERYRALVKKAKGER